MSRPEMDPTSHGGGGRRSQTAEPPSQARASRRQRRWAGWGLLRATALFFPFVLSRGIFQLFRRSRFASLVVLSVCSVCFWSISGSCMPFTECGAEQTPGTVEETPTVRRSQNVESPKLDAPALSPKSDAPVQSPNPSGIATAITSHSPNPSGFATAIISHSDNPARKQNVLRIVREYLSVPQVREIIIALQGANSIQGLESLRRVPRVRLISIPEGSSAAGRWNVPVKTDAVFMNDDDVVTNATQLVSMLSLWEKRPNSLFGVEARLARRDYYESFPLKDPSENVGFNMLLPWTLLFNKKMLTIFNSVAHHKQRNLVISQAGHCDDVLFNLLHTVHFGDSPKIQLSCERSLCCHPLPSGNVALSKGGGRLWDRAACTTELLDSLDAERHTVGPPIVIVDENGEEVTPRSASQRRSAQEHVLPAVDNASDAAAVLEALTALEKHLHPLPGTGGQRTLRRTENADALFSAKVASQPWVRAICEISFGAGHATVAALASNPTAIVHSLGDLQGPRLENTSRAFVESSFPDRLKYFRLKLGKEGTPESPDMVREWQGAQSCDLFIFGGGQLPKLQAKYLWFLRYLSAYPNVVLVHDSNREGSAVSDAYKQALAEGYMAEVDRVLLSEPESNDHRMQMHIAQYALTTAVVIALGREQDRRTLESIVAAYLALPFMRDVIIVSGTKTIPKAFAGDFRVKAVARAWDGTGIHTRTAFVQSREHVPDPDVLVDMFANARSGPVSGYMRRDGTEVSRWDTDQLEVTIGAEVVVVRREELPRVKPVWSSVRVPGTLKSRHKQAGVSAGRGAAPNPRRRGGRRVDGTE